MVPDDLALDNLSASDLVDYNSSDPLIREFPVRLRSEKNVTGAWPGGIVFPPDIPVAAPQAVIDLKYWGEQAHQESLMGKPAW